MPRSRNLLVATVVTLGLIAAGPLAESDSAVLGSPLSDIPALIHCDRAPLTDGWKPLFAGADDVRSAEFVCSGGAVSASIALWRTQAPGREAVSEATRVVPREWRFITSSTRMATSADFDVEEILVGHEEFPQVIWTWYAVGDRPVASDIEAKLREAINAALFKRAPTAVFVIGAGAGTVEAARALLRAHIAAVWRAYLMSQSAA